MKRNDKTNLHSEFQEMRKRNAEQTQYIEPKGFKGTEGEWVTAAIKNGIVIKEKFCAEIGFSDRIAEIYEYPNQKGYNAQLICQSKKLAKALQDIVKEIENANWEDGAKNQYRKFPSDLYLNAKQVLKDAGLE